MRRSAVRKLGFWRARARITFPNILKIMSQHQRSRILVDPKVQWSIAARIVCHWVLFLVCLVTMGAMVRLMAGAGGQSFSESLKTALVTQIPILGIMFFMLPVFLRDTLKLSNRFAGPMYRLRTSLKDVCDNGTTRPIKFRTGDFWQEVAGDFNTVIAQMDELRRENESLKAELRQSEQVSV